MARSRYQSANKELGEMYEHELEQTAEEIDATIDELIAESNALMSTNAALRAELARVKAESLRVVVDGEACVLDGSGPFFILYEGSVYSYGEHNAWYQVSDPFRCCSAGPDTIVQPVRLERWEDE